MTRIDFHFNVQHPMVYTCRLIRKAYNQGLKPVVYSTNPMLLADLDEQLWTFSASDFIPHALTGHAKLAEHPVVLTHQASDIHCYDVLINLDTQCPSFFARFDRLVEIVSLEAHDKQHARARFQYYKERGYPIFTHNQHNAAAHTVMPHQQEVRYG